MEHWYGELIGPPPSMLTIVHFERVLDVLRHPGFAGSELPERCAKAREKIRRRMRDVGWPERLPRRVIDHFVKVATSVAPEALDRSKSGGSSQLVMEAQVDAAIQDVLDVGIRDWARTRIGAGCHLWAPARERGK